MKLHIELIPKTCWGSNLRTKFKKSDWDKIRKSVYEKEKMHCHICGIECKSLDAHEVWDFEEKNHIQKLIDIIGVCKECHSAIHYGRAQKIGYGEQAQKQFIKVNGCDILDLQEELIRVKSDFLRRSKINNWKLDLSFIEKQGYVIKED
ncbi:hypothetical protein [Clostridium butyricum]|uniref:hypothetical protein n=1 Tax=Clostridium butyricum TaxID=1492 RepID=UPI002105A925|nr:hypothetical protein [Clostridium butyricum]MCQ2026828.1 hypothetical protein [Clostridium butyricum]